MKQRVVVTGIGLVCGGSLSAEDLFSRIKNQQSWVRKNEKLAATGLVNAACAYVEESHYKKLAQQFANDALPPLAAPSLVALDAATQALAQSGIDLSRPARKGIFSACNKQSLRQEDLVAMARRVDKARDKWLLDLFIEMDRPCANGFYHKHQDMTALALAALYDMQDVQMTSGDACAAGGISVGTGYQWIASGELDVALVGAAETGCSYVTMQSFSVLGAMADQANIGDPSKISRPFDKNRSGFAMGDGSAFLVLESEQHALARGATILAYISGFSKQTESWRITSSPKDGSDYARCMARAISDAGLALEDIDHINAHGTSTEQNDACEGLAIKRLWGDKASHIPVTSNKSAVGHCLAAAGAIEAALSVLSLKEQTLLPTLNFEQPDKDTQGLWVVQEPIHKPTRHILSNSFGFGGENASLVMSAPEVYSGRARL